MKTLILALPFMYLFALQLQAQNEQSLSFNISDTLMVEANSIELGISHYTFTNDKPESDIEGMGEKISFEDLKKFCEDFQVKRVIEPKGKEELELYGYRERVIILQFDSRKEMLSCFLEAGKFAHVLPQVKQLSLTDEESYYDTLFLQTLEKGKAKARRYARLLDKKVASLSSIEERAIYRPDEEEMRARFSGGWTIYPPLSVLPPEEIPINTKVPIICTLRLSFELE